MKHLPKRVNSLFHFNLNVGYLIEYFYYFEFFFGMLNNCIQFIILLGCLFVCFIGWLIDWINKSQDWEERKVEKKKKNILLFLLFIIEGKYLFTWRRRIKSKPWVCFMNPIRTSTFSVWCLFHLFKMISSRVFWEPLYLI